MREARTILGGAAALLDGGRAGKTSRREARAALVSAAALYTVGAMLCATAALLPHVSSPAAVVAIAVAAFLTAVALMLAYARQRRGLTLAWVADLWGVVLVALLCAATGGAGSPFGLVYFFAIGHAAAFQPRGRLLVVWAAGLIAFLAPLAYSHVSSSFGAFACVGIVLALLASGLVHFALERVRQQRWRLEFLIAATAHLDTSLDPQQTLQKIARTAVPELAELCVIDLIDADGWITTTVAAAVDSAVARSFEDVRNAQPLHIRGHHPIARALQARKPFIAQDLADSAAFQLAAESDEQARFMRDAGCRSAAVFPMIARGRMLGAVSFLHLGEDVSYEQGQLAVLDDLTGRAALAYDNARLYAERARVAHTLRRSLMPAALPAIAGLDLASFFRPMGAGNEVGGDFYDVFGDRSSCWLVVGDVCGKGADAAVLTGFLRHTTIAYAREGVGPASVLARVNQAMLEQDFDGRFATAILARLAFRSSEVQVTLAAAGHPPALIARTGGAAEEFGDCGTLLGVFADPVISESSMLLRPGDTLALYTDGLSEAHAPERTVSVQEMLAQLAGQSPRSAQATIDALLELVELTDDARDDVAVLAARVKPAGSAA
ncbi:MAG: putative sensor protein [Solirubrobacterales bacterium]|jgi:serine phosphatase RsbU (regulator of sigma subunit)|nr:putative sensor protein [Solirubrobacterales bacterium]